MNKKTMSSTSARCPRVLVADHDCEALAVLRRMFERHGCDVYQCLCHHELQGMLSALIETPVLLSVEMVVCHIRIAELTGVSTLASLQKACDGPEIVLVMDEQWREARPELSPDSRMTVVDDVYDHGEQAKMFRLLARRLDRISGSI